MNITDLIVELLRQGKQVELPGMGTFGSEMQPPHYDKASGTYFPASRTLTFSTATSGDESIVSTLAERECVGENVARQMWQNYLDALNDKLQRNGSHAFGDLGTLNYNGGEGFSFASNPGVVLSSGDEKPLEGVKIYAHDEQDDPFAQFEEPADRSAELKAQQEAAEAAARAEQERIEAEHKAEQERLAAEQARLEAERKAEEERLAAEAATKQAQAEREAAEERAAAEAAAALAALDTQSAEAATPSNDTPAAETAKPGKDNDNDEKKKRFPWWILLLLLLLLLIGGGAYYYLTHRNTETNAAAATPTATKHLEGVPVTNDLTYNTDMLEYNQRDIDNTNDQLCRYMSDYIYSYLAYRHYAGAMEPMMERVHQYAGERLGTLMADRYAVQRFYPFSDYVYSYNEPCLKQNFANEQRYTVQAELLDMHTLDGILERMVQELGLEPDAAVPGNAAAATPAPAVRKTAEKEPTEAPVTVNMEQNSKQGFDIIAGFYLDRDRAARLTARLHELGSDAYIIEKNNMYYVSMGSAKNRTAAEALFKHIKSWYDGDIAIKQW